MDELIKLVSAKAGIPEAQAGKAVDTVLDFLKERLPDSLAGQLDTLIAGGDGASGAADLLKGLSGLLGNK